MATTTTTATRRNFDDPVSSLTGQLVVAAWLGLGIWLRWYTTASMPQDYPTHQETVQAEKHLEPDAAAQATKARNESDSKGKEKLE